MKDVKRKKSDRFDALRADLGAKNAVANTDLIAMIVREIDNRYGDMTIEEIKKLIAPSNG